MKKIIEEILDLAIAIAFLGTIGYGVYFGPKKLLFLVKKTTIKQIKKQNFSLNEFSRKMTGKLH